MAELGFEQFVAVVKAGQQSSEDWRQAWREFTDEYNGTRDPSRHDAAVLRKFVKRARPTFGHEQWFTNLIPPGVELEADALVDGGNAKSRDRFAHGSSEIVHAGHRRYRGVCRSSPHDAKANVDLGSTLQGKIAGI